ncbi:tetratricopeptide repeat protein [Brevibacillus sp. Leaf182]|uniref:tetratricopeptide repeat protein n=1 Tax=Brevibacillus sp. Leaf182 TaxID=1736290 RepID=UPI0006FB9149|nr:tetratricopeptide repeat protein [Brevibacillus sp. Leaf182]
MIKRKVIYSFVLVAAILMNTACSDSEKTTDNGQTSSTDAMNEVKAKYDQGLSLYNQGKLEEAKIIFEECIANDPTNGIYDFFLGNILRMKNDFPNAIVYYENAIKKSPDLLEAYNNTVALHMATKNYDQALVTADQGLKVQPDFADLKFKKAQILYVKKQYNDAISLFTELAKDPVYFEAYRFLGLSYIGLNDKTKALEHLKTYLNLAPEGVQFKEKIKQIVSDLEKGIKQQ